MEDVSQKILQYEHFVNETLRTDLLKLNKLRDGCYEEISQYLQLQSIVENALNPEHTGTSLKVQVDLGCNFYAQAVVSNPSTIFVRVGYGFYVEFSHAEALSFITKKTDHLNTVVQSLSKDIAAIKAQIRMVFEGLRELQNFDQNTKI